MEGAGGAQARRRAAVRSRQRALLPCCHLVHDLCFRHDVGLRPVGERSWRSHPDRPGQAFQTRSSSGTRRRRGRPLADIAVVEDPTRIYRRTPIWKRVFAFGGLGVMSVVMGLLLAMVLALVAVAVLTLLAGLS